MHISISIDTTLQNHVVALNRPLCSGCGFASLCIDRYPRGVGISDKLETKARIQAFFLIPSIWQNVFYSNT